MRRLALTGSRQSAWLRARLAEPWRGEGLFGVSQVDAISPQDIGKLRRRLTKAGVDGLLVAGRAVSCDATSHSFLREIPQCWMTGQAAGVAAALAVAEGVKARDVPIARLQETLYGQGALVRAGVAA